MKEKDLFERIFLSNVMSKNSSLMFTVEQWELTRRLRLTGLTKEQVCQAFDDLDKMEKDLSCLFTTLSPHSALSTNTPTNNSHHNELVLKNFQLLMAKNLANINQQQQQQQQQHQTSNSDNYNNSIQSTNAAFMIVHNHFLKVNDPDTENKEIDDFKSKGEVAIHSEISFFVYKHDLKQSQISRMAGVNQAYVSKFLRGEFFELSENGKTLIYKWYLRFLKNPTIFLQTHKISLGNNTVPGMPSSTNTTTTTTTNNNTTTTNTNSTTNNNNNNNNNNNTTNQSSILHNNFINDSINRINTYSSFAHNVTNLSLDTPKRTRFSFKPEHLAILENAFTENQYPDQKKREEITKMCNGSRNCSDREKVTEQVITHWFQNKRKITRKLNLDDSTKSPDDIKPDLQKISNNNHQQHHNQQHKNNNNNNNNNNHLDTTSNSNNSPLNYQEYIEEASSSFNAVLIKPSSSPSKSNEESSDDIY